MSFIRRIRGYISQGSQPGRLDEPGHTDSEGVCGDTIDRSESAGDSADGAEFPKSVADAGGAGLGEGARTYDPIVVGRPSPQFEPKAADAEYHLAQLRPDTSLDGWSSQLFAMRAASMRGRQHRYDGLPRQDDFAVALHPADERLLVAVADGVSAAKQSHIGATTAVRYAVQWLEANLHDVTAETNWNGLVANTAWAMIEQASTLFGIDKDAEMAERLIASTLVCAVLDTNPDGTVLAHVIGVGDSGAWVILGDGSFKKVVEGKETSESGLTSSTVSGLPRVPDGVQASTFTVNPGELLILGTDGIGDPLGSGTGEVGRLLASTLAGRVPSMIEFAHVVDFSRETFDDDRTLVAVWPRLREESDR